MNDLARIIARMAARQLEAGNPGIVAEVEAVLAAQGFAPSQRQYVDPTALGSLIVSIASLAWTVYADLERHKTKPTSETLARTIRVTLRDREQLTAPDRIVDAVVTETIRAAPDATEWTQDLGDADIG